ncbi:MAG: FMN-binding protein [Flavobacteriaceae bacterium]|nr:FMN-binding protein [Flavobacteriaceae bacterium]
MLLLPLLMLCMKHQINDLPKKIQKKVDKELKATFEGQTPSLISFLIDTEIQKSLDAPFGDSNFFKIQSEADKTIGYAYIGSSLGKTDMFDYLIIFDKELSILRSKILIYREDYGGEIGSRRWLKQFEGKSFNSRILDSGDIMAISGATISVNAMTAAVNDVLYSLKNLKEKGIFE